MKIEHFWYDQAVIKFELIKSLQQRELCLIEKSDHNRSIRNLRCHSVQHLDFILHRWMKIKERKINYNFFYSLAKYKNGVPFQTANYEKRDNTEWNKKHWYEMTEYDFLLDVDAPNHETIMLAHESASMVKHLFDQWKVPYELRFTGCGFHFIIPHFYWVNTVSNFQPGHQYSVYAKFHKLGRWFYDNYTELVDYSIYDSRRVAKIPYSLALYPGNAYICWPFNSNEEFEAFYLPDYEATEWLDRIPQLKGRGTYVFNQKGNCKELVTLAVKAPLKKGDIA